MERHPTSVQSVAVIAAALGLFVLSGGCAFDLVRVKQLPVTLTAATAPRSFVLNTAVEVSIGTTYPVKLKSGTTWSELGATQFGEAYTSKDQVLTVEGSNIHEAALVVRDGAVAGFYLLIEKKFCPATNPVKLTTTPQ